MSYDLCGLRLVSLGTTHHSRLPMLFFLDIGGIVSPEDLGRFGFGSSAAWLGGSTMVFGVQEIFKVYVVIVIIV